MSSPDDVPSTSKRTDNDGAIDYGTLDTDMEHDIFSYIDGGPTTPLLKTPPGMKTSFDTVMDPDNGSPSTQHLEHMLFPVSGKGYIISWLNGGRTPSPLTSPGRMTLSDTAMDPDNGSPFDTGTPLYNVSEGEDKKSLLDEGKTSQQLRISPSRMTPSANTSTQHITSNLEAEDEVRIEDFPEDDLMNKLGVSTSQTHQPTETCNEKRPDEETNLPGVEVKPTEIEIGVQLQTITVIAINGKHQIPIWKQFDQTANRPELNNAAPSPSSNAIGPSQPSTSGTPVRGSKRTAKGNVRDENKRLKVVPLHARELTDDEELNNRIRKARTTKRHHEEKKRCNEELKSRVEELTSQLEESQKENTDLKSENTDLKSENTDLKSENTDLKSENTDLKSENTDLKSENTDLKSQHN